MVNLIRDDLREILFELVTKLWGTLKCIFVNFKYV